MNHMNEIFGDSTAKVGLAGFLDNAKSLVAEAGWTTARQTTASSMLTMESLTAPAREDLVSAYSAINASLSGYAVEAFPVEVDKFGKDIQGPSYTTKAQLRAASIAAILGGDLKAAINAPTTHSVVAQEGLMVMEAPSAGIEKRRAAMEEYDETATATSVAFSIAYNFASAKQDAFGEALYPTVVIPPDQAGLMMSVATVLLQNDAKRQLNGTVTDFKRVNVIRAQTYPSLLQTDSTNAVPVHRDENANFFVDATLLPPKDLKMDDGSTLTTSALAIGKTFDLITLSQTDALLNAGTMDITDTIDPGVYLDNLYITVGTGAGTEVFSFGTKDLQGAAWNYSVQNNYKDLVLNFDTNSLAVDKDKKTATGATSVALAAIAAGSYKVRLGAFVSGKMNVNVGNTNVIAGEVGVTGVMDANDQPLSLTTGAGKTIADLFIGSKVIGYDLAAKRSNANRRQRGQLVTTTTERRFYPVNLLPPVTVLKPHSAGDANDANDLAALVFTTHTRASNAAVAHFLSSLQTLKAVAGSEGYGGQTLNTIGMAALLLDPYYEEQDYIAPAVVDSIKSHERAADIQASLVNMIRDMVYRMWQKSAYQPAANSQAGGMAPNPTVIIACDQVTEQYLMITGDLRTLGNSFPVKIVSTTNIEMRGKIGITFGNMETAAAGVPNILHWGTMQYRPEMVIVLPTSRDGQNSKEITVSPSFQHHVNLPVACLINVSGIEEVVNRKVPVNLHTVP